MAIGALRAHILGLILSEGLAMTADGLLVGVAGAFALTRLFSEWLFGVRPADPLTFVAVPLALLAVASLACVFPAWSATRVDPVQVLRHE